jgi:HAD superfamily hydrolase (TIGR01509 family)
MAILYDLGDVFFEAHYWRRWMYDQLSASGSFEGDFRDFYERYERILIPVYEGRTEYGDAYRGFVESLNTGDTDGFIERSLRVKKFYEDTRKLYPGVRDTVKLLNRHGVRQVVISDNEASGVTVRSEILTRFGLARHVDSVITSHDVGCRKPDPRIFEAALKSAGCGPEDALFVGHDKNEIDGAAGLGLVTVEFNNYLGYRTDAEEQLNLFPELLQLAGVPAVPAAEERFPETWV